METTEKTVRLIFNVQGNCDDAKTKNYNISWTTLISFSPSEKTAHQIVLNIPTEHLKMFEW